MKQASQKKTTRRPLAIQMSHRLREGLLIIALAIAIFLLISFSTYHSSDPGWSSTGMGNAVVNWGGRVGAFLADVLLSIFGYIAYLVPPIIVFAAWLGVCQHREADEFKWGEFIFKLMGFILIIFSSCGLMALSSQHHSIHLPVSPGGILGDVIASGFTHIVNSAGSALFLLTALLCGITLFTGFSWLGLIDVVGWQGMQILAVANHYLREKYANYTKVATVPPFEPTEPKLRKTAGASSPGKIVEPKMSLAPASGKMLVPSGASVASSSVPSTVNGNLAGGALNASGLPTVVVEPRPSIFKRIAAFCGIKRKGSQTLIGNTSAASSGHAPLQIGNGNTLTTPGHVSSQTGVGNTFAVAGHASHQASIGNASAGSEHVSPQISGGHASAASGHISHQAGMGNGFTASGHSSHQTDAGNSSIGSGQVSYQAHAGSAPPASGQFPHKIHSSNALAAAAGQSSSKSKASSGNPSANPSYMTSKVDIGNVIVAPGQVPPLHLLDPPPRQEIRAFSNLTLEQLSQLVEQRLLDFGVEVKVAAVYPGPVITRFELELAPGIKVSKITGLAKDIARSLSVISVRVVDVIPGKSVIGLELPNEQREVVGLREILESQHYLQSRSPVSLALGKDIAGYPVVVDLAKMPHLLVAGTTGSGKSVSLNAMLLSMLFKATPEQLRLIMIDPKMLELSIYEGIPHLLTPVITDMKDAANALRWCVTEMDRRYRLMASLGVRNLAGCNAKIVEAAKQGAPIPTPEWLMAAGHHPSPELQPLPMIVVVADELADMMMVVGKKVEDLVTRIAQKARAAGIHLILATQRPSVDVITGLIKANVPTRIAFQVSSRIDSRTILDQQGAEQLLGNGDMLYLPPGTGVPVRVHGAYVADEEVHRVVAAWQTYGQPDYLDAVTEGGSETGGEEEGSGEMDPLYDEALRIVTESRRASISLVQRRLRIGYNRAARIMEDMEASGVVSAMDQNGSREVIAPPPV